ncbi:MAG: hypothetical protein H6741_02580 [Alphaproteobacteria bacterium]|nr:hypothetical protein [Alphaproteobacteria bacterium]MCB9791590.1 hypothetical protein [Alphaproteobacteria bacterium]
MSRSKIANHALITAFTPLIPLPFVDDWARAHVRRKLYAALAAERGVTLTPEHLNQLAQGTGCSPMGCLVTAFVWPIKKLFKTALIFLLIKECLDIATETLHRGEMIKMASEAGLLPEQTSDVKALMESTLSALSISPVSRVVLFRKRPALPERVPPAPGYRLEGLAGKLQALGGGGIVLREFERELDSLAAPAAEE